jgi:hypothetical protein
MGQRGPLPKREDQRVRRNKTGEDGLEVDKFDLEGEVLVPWAVFEHSYVQGLWQSLQESVTKELYEPTDWQYARIALKLLDDALMADKMPGAMLISALDGMLGKMLVTEADRRRLKIEASRSGEKEAGKLIDAASTFRDRFERQREA